MSGKYRAGAAFQPNDVRATFDPEKMRKDLAEVENIRAAEVPAGIPMSQWAIAWCLKDRGGFGDDPRLQRPRPSGLQRRRRRFAGGGFLLTGGLSAGLFREDGLAGGQVEEDLFESAARRRWPGGAVRRASPRPPGGPGA